MPGRPAHSDWRRSAASASAAHPRVWPDVGTGAKIPACRRRQARRRGRPGSPARSAFSRRHVVCAQVRQSSACATDGGDASGAGAMAAACAGGAECNDQRVVGELRLDAKRLGGAKAQIDIVPEHRRVAAELGPRARHDAAMGVPLDDLEPRLPRRLVERVRQLAKAAAGAWRSCSPRAIPGHRRSRADAKGARPVSRS